MKILINRMQIQAQKLKYIIELTAIRNSWSGLLAKTQNVEELSISLDLIFHNNCW